jgi:putative transposase
MSIRASAAKEYVEEWVSSLRDSYEKKHTAEEIATKLAHAHELATQGRLQGEIARTLGVSIMTLHRWRKTPPGSRHASLANRETHKRVRTAADRMAELQVENSRLRRLITDLLLEKIKLEEVPRVERIFRRKEEIVSMSRSDQPGGWASTV